MTLKPPGKKFKSVEGNVEVGKHSSSYKALIIITALAISVFHRNHIAGMFESDRHFSHLSTLERELTFRTEMGLYYSYFKTITEAPSFHNGLNQIMYDNVTEYPLVINTLKRFNLYPEVLLGGAYRIYDQVMTMMGRQTMVCYQVTRGNGQTPVQSCEGLGEKPYFYVEAVFWLNGLGMGVFFLLGSYLSESYFGGLVTVMCFFYNHGECTRIQWTPPLRESFSYPFLVLQMLFVTYTIRSGEVGRKVVFWIGISTAAFMLPWQFAQFALLMQTLSLFATYLLGFVAMETVKVVVAGQMAGLLASVVLLFGNEMLVASFFSSSLFAVWLVLYMEKFLRKTSLPQILISIIQGLSLLLLTLYIKLLASKLLNIADDEHIGDIFRSKFSSFRNFHTMLYLCAPEFDFMESATPVRLSKTLLLPSAIIVSLLIIVKVVFPQLKTLLTIQSSSPPSVQTSKELNEDANNHQSRSKDTANGTKPTKITTSSTKGTSTNVTNKEGAEMVYHLLQGISFTLMALIIMRLKLFWTPHLCILVSLLASKKFLPATFRGYNYHSSLLVVLVAMMSVGGMWNVKQQWSIQGEFSNVNMESLIDWINANTHQKAVFGGPMPTMATIKLCTARPIVNHPHYEDVGLRNRTVLVYSMFSRKDPSVVHQHYKQLQMDYFIVEEHWCLRRPKPGCGMTDLWDMEDKENLGNDAVCKVISEQKEGPYFQQVFKNSQYAVFRVK